MCAFENQNNNQSPPVQDVQESRSYRPQTTKKKSTKLLLIFSIFVIVLGGSYLLYDKVVLEYTSKPDIKLNGNVVETIDIFSEFVDPGVTVTLRGKKPKNKVEIVGNVDSQVIGEYVIEYRIANNKGKKESVVERKVIVTDLEPPTIELLGSSMITIIFGNSYIEEGAIATDNYDGDLSATITIEGTVDTSKISDVNLVYHVADSSGNQAEVKRIVRVRGNPPPSNAVFLTFDDGPSVITEEILDILKKNNSKATFFVIGSQLDKYANVIKRAHDEGHAIALHSNTHKYEEIYASDEAFWNDINTLSERVEKITGEKSRLLRFPGGTSNSISASYNEGIMTRLVTQAHEKGYQIYDWSIDSFDASANSVPASTISSSVINELGWSQGNDIVLLHDAKIKQTTVEALNTILSYGKSNGFTFKAMDLNTPEKIQKIRN